MSDKQTPKNSFHVQVSVDQSVVYGDVVNRYAETVKGHDECHQLLGLKATRTTARAAISAAIQALTMLKAELLHDEVDNG